MSMAHPIQDRGIIQNVVMMMEIP